MVHEKWCLENSQDMLLCIRCRQLKLFYVCYIWSGRYVKSCDLHYSPEKYLSARITFWNSSEGKKLYVIVTAFNLIRKEISLESLWCGKGIHDCLIFHTLGRKISSFESYLFHFSISWAVFICRSSICCV